MRLLLTAVIAASALAGAAEAQSRWSHSYGGQADRPGDFRCDAYWDRGRTDCDAAWRDQRPYRVSHWRRWSGYGHGYGWRAQPGAAYHGAYGRPDLVYPSGGQGYGRGYGGGSRDGRRIDWCRATYRSYDPNSGYYRAYSGRLIYCG